MSDERKVTFRVIFQYAKRANVVFVPFCVSNAEDNGVIKVTVLEPVVLVTNCSNFQNK